MWQREERVRAQCYPASRRILPRTAGGALILAGMLLILLCVPAWVTFVGAALILPGLLLIRK